MEIKGDNGKVIRQCANLTSFGGQDRLSFPVKECSGYEKKGTMSLWQMERTAYYIEQTKEGKNGIGFSFKKKNEGEII